MSDFKWPECTLSDEELARACEKELSDMCKTSGKSFTMRIPAQLNKDTDFLFSALIERFKKKIKSGAIK